MMGLNFRVSELHKNDVLPAVELVRSVFPAKGLLRSIYRAGGVALHISDELRNPLGMYEYFVVKVGEAGKEELVGFCECKILPDNAVSLNMIATARGYNGCGIGNTLLRFCIDRYQLMGKAALMLDVSGYNAIARNWYEREGFRQYRETYIYQLAQITHGNDFDVRLLNYPQYSTLQSIYGFAQLQLMTGARITRAGIIESDIFISAGDDECVEGARIAARKLGMKGVYLIADADYGKGSTLVDAISGMQLMLSVTSMDKANQAKPIAII